VISVILYNRGRVIQSISQQNGFHILRKYKNIRYPNSYIHQRARHCEQSKDVRGVCAMVVVGKNP